jgi:hypothetical protein
MVLKHACVRWPPIRSRNPQLRLRFVRCLVAPSLAFLPLLHAFPSAAACRLLRVGRRGNGPSILIGNISGAHFGVHGAYIKYDSSILDLTI